MQEQAKEQMIQKLIEYMESSKDFLLEQSPELIQQALRYEKASAYFSSALMAILLCAAVSIGYYFWKNPTLDKYGSREMGSFLGAFIPLIITPMFFVQLCYSVDKLLKLYIAPKYFLITLISSFRS